MADKNKEQLPLDFITTFVSRGWEEVGNLKAQIEGIKRTFSGTQKVSKILQDLIDAYLIALGQMELYIDKKDYLDLPDDKELQEQLNEDLDIEIKPEADKVVIEVKPEVAAEEQPDESIKTEEQPAEEKPVEEPFEFFTSFDEPIIDTNTVSPYQAWMSTSNG